MVSALDHATMTLAQDTYSTKNAGETYVYVSDFEQDLSLLQTKSSGEIKDGDTALKQAQESEDGVLLMVCAIVCPSSWFDWLIS